MAQAKQVADMGAVIEICFLQFLAGPNAPLPFLTHWTQVNAKNVAQAVKEIGAKSVVVSTDLGQVRKHDASRRHRGRHRRDEARRHLRRRHRLMMRKNPARLLGL
jgi:hypothetical protein